MVVGFVKATNSGTFLHDRSRVGRGTLKKVTLGIERSSL